MATTVDVFYESVRCLRSGGISTALVDSVKVAVYGQQTPIKHLAFTSGGGVRPISVKPHDPGLLSAIAKELQNQGLNAYVFSKDSINVSVPPPSGEDREQLKRHVRKLGEDAKIAIRNIRKQFRNALKTASQEEKFSLEKEIQTKTDASINTIEQIVTQKIRSFD